MQAGGAPILSISISHILNRKPESVDMQPRHFRSFTPSCYQKRFALHAAATAVLCRIRKYIPAFVNGSLRRAPFSHRTGCLPAYAHALLRFAGMYVTCMVPSRGTLRALTWDEHRAAPGGWCVFRKIMGQVNRSTVYEIVKDD